MRFPTKRVPRDETLIIVDEDESETETTEFIIIDDGDSSETSFEPYFEPTGRFRGDYRTRALWDVVHEGDAEDVFEWWQQLNLYLKYQFAEQWDTVVETDTRYGVLGEAPQENPFWGVNVSYSRERESGCLRSHCVRVTFAGEMLDGRSRLGREFLFGGNELFAAGDFLNPVNAQGDVVGLLSDPRMAKEPIWAIDASYQLDDHVLQLVVVPIFARSDVPIIGRKISLWHRREPT